MPPPLSSSLLVQVHVQDLSRLYLLLLSNSLKLTNLDPPVSSPDLVASNGWSNLIYAGLNQHTWGPVVSLLGDLLYARGDVAQSGAKGIHDDEGEGYMVSEKRSSSSAMSLDRA